MALTMSPPPSASATTFAPDACACSIGAKVGGVKRMADAAEHLSTSREHRAGRVGFERMAERIVDGEKEPGITAFGDDRAGEARRQCVAVVDPRCLRRRAGFAGEGRAADRSRNGDAVAF